jgi:hypothetical protein
VSGLCRARPPGSDFDADGLGADFCRGFGDGCCLPSYGELQIEGQASTHTGCSRDGGTVAEAKKWIAVTGKLEFVNDWEKTTSGGVFPLHWQLTLSPMT